MIIKRIFFSFLAILLIAFIGQSDLSAQGDDLNSQLLLASRDGDINKVKELIERGADVNSEDESLASTLREGGTALAKAAKKGHEDIVLYLIERGADVDRVIVATPDISVFLKDLREIEKNIEKNVEVNIKELAASTINMLTTRWLIKNNINYYDFIFRSLKSLSEKKLRKVFNEDLVRQLIRSYKNPKTYNSYIKNILKLAEEQLDKPELKRKVKNALFEKQALQKELKRGRFSDIDIVTQE